MTTYCITGGTGSFGSSLTRHLLQFTPYNVRVLDRSEAKLERMMAVYPPDARTTYVLADIRDRDRLVTAFHGADTIVHAAALKTVPLGEVYASEFFKTNCLGTVNVIEAAVANRVNNVLFISSDKACQPYNGYGKSKSVGEWLVTAANLHSGGVRLASVRGGNVWMSRGSVIEKWLTSDTIKVYGANVTRFNLEMNYWLDFCLQSVHHTHGGEIFIPKCPAWNLSDLSIAFSEVFRDKMRVGCPARHGDKVHETLVSLEESANAKDLGWCYVIEPSEEVRRVWNYIPHEGKPVTEAITSDRARRMGIDELRTLISRSV